MSCHYSYPILLFIIMFIFTAFSSIPTYGIQDTVYGWQEGEEPSEANFAYEANPTGNGSLLSNGNYLYKTISGEQLSREVPEEGLLLSYRMEVPESGKYQLWVRIGWEWARAPFEWRINDGQWQMVERTQQTTNVMQLGLWMEVAWLQLDTLELSHSTINIQFRYKKPSNDNRLLMGIDCITLVKGNFVPEGKLKPGEKYDNVIDIEAENQVFQLPDADGSSNRTSVKLNGTWQVARYDDPDMDVNTYQPLQELPSPDVYPLRWMGINIPGTLWNKSETVFAHRVIYRTKVKVPASHEDRGFFLHFSGTNWLISTFVNGELAGTHQGVWIPWDLDISPYVKFDAVNEIAVAVKGCYYAIDKEYYGEEKDLDRYRNIPRSVPDHIRWVTPVYPTTKGDGNGHDYGIVNPVTLVSVGNAYVEDVFIKPSVEKKLLESKVTIRNTKDTERNVKLLCEAIYEKDNSTEKTFGPFNIKIPAKDTKTFTVSGSWEDPKLWWPVPDPHLYRLRTTIIEDDEVLDIQEELFGFREVTIEGTGVYINGVRRNFWNWVGVAGSPWTGEEWLKSFHRDKDRFTRFSMNRKTSNFLKTREERLEFYDRNGIPGRLCSMIDGMFITFALGHGRRIENNREEFVPNTVLWENFQRHMDQLTKAYRNHPSVIMYQVENELVYINGMNIYGSFLDEIEELMDQVVEAGRKNDPTRPYTVGGGGDLSGRLEINSPHYPLGSLDFYPDNAYTVDKYSNKITRWPWERKKPWVVGESVHANELEFGSYVDGDEIFRGTYEALKGKAKFLRMLYGGYRWAGVSGFFPWDNLHNYEDGQKTFSDLCVIPRKQTHRLYAGRENQMLFKVMNDTLSSEPVTFQWSYVVNDNEIAEDEAILNIEPGFGMEQTLVIPAPDTNKRLEGTLTLKASQSGAEEFTDVRSIPVMPVVNTIKTDADVIILDRSDKLSGFLNSCGLEFTNVNDTNELSFINDGLLIIGPDTLKPAESFGQDILAFAAKGGRVIVLEQEVPLAGSNLPIPVTTTTHYGGYAHSQALGTPLFRELSKDDLIDWQAGHPTYKNVYVKPTQGARSLVECGEMLRYTALTEMPCGQGVIITCQLLTGANLGLDPGADILLRNMIETYSKYTPSLGVVAVYSPSDNLLADSVRKTGFFAQTVQSVEEALNPEEYKAAVIHASKGNLSVLNNLRGEAEKFQQAGGWIMLAGLTPEGLEEFNALMGTNHMIRPFRVERVTLESPDFLLAATLGNRDVSMYGTEWIARWAGKRWISGNVYTYVIDGKDAAPFCQMPDGPEDILEYTPTYDDKDPYNFVNGMLGSDFWRYIRQIWVPEEGAEPLIFKFRRPETIKQINIWNNANYWTIKDMDIIADGRKIASVELPDSDELTQIVLPKPIKVEEGLNLQIRSWRENRIGRSDLRLVGIDNVQFLRADMPEDTIFIDNVGGLVSFPMSKGGILLNQIKFMEDEPNEENNSKKLRIMNVLLQNMGAGSSTSTVALPGVNVRYKTVNITDYCNQYVTERSGKAGWFGDKNKDLRNVKMGEQTLSNVTYHLVDYNTAPVPDCIMLGGNRAQGELPEAVRDIKIGKKADMIFFLHTFNATHPIMEGQQPEAFRYVIHYDDGESLDVPVLLFKHVAHWEQKTPKPLQEASVAKTFIIPASEDKKGVLYSMQVKNPRPDISIKSIDVTLVKDRYKRMGWWGVPAVLGITLGNILE
ncbi:hypothetical protein GF312_00205 [Candidatus Poribacteria bacterium]|nr:hypothetical protein [Candidatus Poribacteria bacterium]